MCSKLVNLQAFINANGTVRENDPTHDDWIMKVSSFLWQIGEYDDARFFFMLTNPRSDIGVVHDEALRVVERLEERLFTANDMDAIRQLVEARIPTRIRTAYQSAFTLLNLRVLTMYA